MRDHLTILQKILGGCARHVLLPAIALLLGSVTDSVMLAHAQEFGRVTDAHGVEFLRERDERAG